MGSIRSPTSPPGSAGSAPPPKTASTNSCRIFGGRQTCQPSRRRLPDSHRDHWLRGGRRQSDGYVPTTPACATPQSAWAFRCHHCHVRGESSVASPCRFQMGVACGTLAGMGTLRVLSLALPVALWARAAVADADACPPKGDEFGRDGCIESCDLPKDAD